MKVLVNGYVGKKITGIGRTLLETIEHIAKIDPTVKFIVVTNYDNDDLFEYPFPRNVEIVKSPVSKMSSLKNLLFNAFVFPFSALKYQVDLVYYPNFTFIPFTFRPVIAVIHDMIEFKVNEKFSKLRMLYRKMIVPRMASISKHIITVSEHSKKDIVEICGVSEEKISVVYNSVSEKFTHSDGFVNEYGDYMLYVGTVDHPGKNSFNAVKAFELYRQNHPDSNLKFIICGMPGKGYEQVFSEIQNSSFKDDIVLTGYVSEATLSGLYKNAKLFVFISYYEGFGLPVLEAMKCGIPVITSNRSSLPEVAGDAALICDPDQIPEIVAAMETILSSEGTAKQLVEKGFRNLKRFSWDVTAKETLKVFKLATNLQ